MRTTALALLAALFAAPVFAQTATWDASPVPNVTYRVYVDGVLVGTTASLSLPLSLSVGTHEIAVSAVAGGLESTTKAVTSYTKAASPQPISESPEGTTVRTSGGTLTRADGVVFALGAPVTGVPGSFAFLKSGQPTGHWGPYLVMRNRIVYGMGSDGGCYDSSSSPWLWTGSRSPCEGALPPAPPPPPTPCTTDPLKVKRISWPSSNSGSRSLTVDTTHPRSALTWTWNAGRQSLTVTDTRGCTVTVTKP